MTILLGRGRALALALVTTLVLLVLPSLASPAEAATPLTVSQAIGQQTGSCVATS